MANTTKRDAIKKGEAQKRENPRKNAMIKALGKTLGVVTPACAEVGIDRNTHYRWLKEDDEYRTKVEELSNIALDFAESKLHSNIKTGDVASILFYLKTKGRKRGYIEKQEVEQTVVGNQVISIKYVDENESGK
jgi:endonuclease I